MNKPMNFKSTFIYLFLALLALLVEISFIQTYNNLPDTDSGIFLYFGQQILQGDIPYRDMWDHKGPVIYYINAISVLIGRGSIWGLYVIEYLSLLCSLFLGYSVMRRAFGLIPAIFSSILLLFGYYYVIEHGNFTEEFTLPLSFAVLYIFWRSINSDSKTNLLYIFIIGAIFSLAFLLRPNNIGVEISIALIIFITGVLNRNTFHLIKQILAFFLGSAFVLILVALYFHWNGALYDFYDAFVRYNIAFSTNTFRKRIYSVIIGLNTLWLSGLALTAIIGWIIGVVNIASKPKRHEKSIIFVSLALIGLPVEFLLSSVSGRSHPHYYMNWLPVFTILTAYFSYEFIKNLSVSSISIHNRKIRLSHIWMFTILLALSLLTLVNISFRVKNFMASDKWQANPSIEVLRNHLKGQNYLLMWGAETAYNYITGIKSPTRYVYQYPFYTCGYTTDEMIEEFLNDIEQKKPLIVDTSSTNENIPPLDKSERSS